MKTVPSAIERVKTRTSVEVGNGSDERSIRYVASTRRERVAVDFEDRLREIELANSRTCTYTMNKAHSSTSTAVGTSELRQLDDVEIDTRTC